jgi:hypothetical protein
VCENLSRARILKIDHQFVRIVFSTAGHELDIFAILMYSHFNLVSLKFNALLSSPVKLKF